MTTNSSKIIDFKSSGETAVSVLLSSSQETFPVKIKKILRDQGISLMDYSQLGKDFNVTISETSRDGGVLWKKDTNEYVIIFNRENHKPRMIWTIAHELGHILLKHHENINNITYDNMEIEANHFAAELLAPSSIIKVLANYGNTIDVDYLQSTFGLSKQAAEKRIVTLNRKISATIDESVCLVYQDFISNNMKVGSFETLNSFETEYEMELERDKWR